MVVVSDSKRISAYSMLVFLAVTIASRLFLSLAWHDYLVNRPEISTPANSIKRVKECIALKNAGISPYEGETCHENPLLVVVIQFLLENCGKCISLIYAILDLLTAIFLGAAASNYVENLKKKEKQFLLKKGENQKTLDSNYGSILITDSSHSAVFSSVVLCYLLNPYSIVSCAALSSTTVYNTLLSLVLYLMVFEQSVLCLFILSFLCISSFYPVVLLSPVCLSFMVRNIKGNSNSVAEIVIQAIVRVIPLVLLFACFCFAWLYASAYLGDNETILQLLDATVGFLLRVPELTPNCGLFWYFFTEMFDHFSLFYLWVFQTNIFVYTIPLTICYRKDPFLLFVELIMLISVFKSYPCVGDAALCLALLPALTHLFKYIRHSLLVGVTLVCCSVLAPVMWSLWIYSGSANANFYFAITLLYSTCHIFLLTDLLYAYLRRDVHMKFGGEKVIINDREAKVMLK